MKILLLGYKGNLGSALCRAVSGDHELIKWEIKEMNLDDAISIKKSILQIKPDVLINTMAYNAVDNCETDDIEYEKAKTMNISLPKILAEACLESDSIFVHYSTDYVFGGYGDDELFTIKNNEGFTEKSTPKPNSRYSETKLGGEIEILEMAKRGLKYYLIRTSKLFGQKGESEFAKPNFFDMMLKLSENNKEIKVVDEERSCFTYTPDLANASLDLVEGDNEYGIYHLVNEGACTWYESVKVLFVLMQKDVKVLPVGSNEFPRPAKRPVYSVLRNTKFKKLRSYQEALKEYLKI